MECKTVVYAFNPVTGEGLTKPAAVKDFELLQTSVLPFEGELFLMLVETFFKSYCLSRRRLQSMLWYKNSHQR